MSGVMPFLSEMSDLIFSLLHYHRHIAIYVVQIIDTPHNCKPCLSFAGFAFCIAVRCGFDKHLYLTSCLNEHNHNTCIPLPQTGCIGRKWHFSLLVKIAKYKYEPVSG